jgi:hypothetical protein
MATLTAERCRELFEYRAGVLYWRVDRPLVNGGVLRMAGKVAGSINKVTRYCEISADGRRYYRHQLVFLMHHGYIPKLIDHENRVRGDDHIENLREATQAENLRNNDSRGYSWNKRKLLWEAYGWANGRKQHLGYFKTEAEAQAIHLEHG